MAQLKRRVYIHPTPTTLIGLGFIDAKIFVITATPDAMEQIQRIEGIRQIHPCEPTGDYVVCVSPLYDEPDVRAELEALNQQPETVLPVPESFMNAFRQLARR